MPVSCGGLQMAYGRQTLRREERQPNFLQAEKFSKRFKFLRHMKMAGQVSPAVLANGSGAPAIAYST
jgi:hypothetical protein